MTKRLDLSLSHESQTQFEQSLAEITHTNKTNLEKVYPFSVRLQQLIRLPPVLYNIPMLYVLLQNLVISMWIRWRNDNPSENYTLYTVALFFSDRDDTAYIASSFTVLAICFISGFWSFLNALLYVKRTELYRASIMISVVFHGIFIPILLPTGAGIIGAALSNCFTNFRAVDIVIVLVGLIAEVVCMAACVFYETRTTYSVFLTNSTACMWEISPKIFYAAQTMVFAFIGCFAASFGRSVQYFFVALHIVSCGYGMYTFWTLPGVMDISNAAGLGVYVGYIVNDILFFAGAPNKLSVLIAGPIVAIIVVSIAMFFVNRARIKKIIQGEMSTPKDKLRQLRLAFSHYDPRYLDGSLIEKLMSNPNLSDSERLKVLQLCAYFPKFDAILLSNLGSFTSSSTLTKAERYMLYTINFASWCRQTLLQPDELTILKSNTASLTTMQRSFWTTIGSGRDYDAYSLYYEIAVRTRTCNGQWQEQTAKYPLNSLVAQTYSNFLIENECDFDQSATWIYKANQLQSGSIFEFDFVTISLLRLFPGYAEEALKQLRLISCDDLDLKSREESLQSFIRNVKLRMEFERAIEFKRSGVLKAIMVVSLLRLVVYVVAFAVMFAVFHGSRRQRVEHLMLAQNVSNVQTATSTVMATLWLQYASYTGKIPSQSNMLTQIGIAVNYDETAGLFNMTRSWIDNTVDYIRQGRISMQYLVSETILALQDPSKKMDYTIDAMHITNLYYKPVVSLTPIGEINFSLREGVVAFYAKGRQMTNLLQPDFALDDHFYECPQIEVGVARRTEDLGLSIKEDESATDDKDIKVNELVLFCSGVLVFVIVVVLSITLHCCFRRELNTMAKKCAGLPENVRKTGSQSLLITSGSELNSDQQTVVKQTSHGCVSATEVIVDLLLNVAVIALFIGMASPINGSTRDLKDLADAIFSAGQRAAHLCQSISFLLGHALANTLQNSLVDYDEMMDEALEDLAEAQNALVAYDYGDSAIGQKLKDLHTHEPCRPTTTETDLHSRYKCGSLDHQFITYLELVRHLRSMDAAVVLTEPEFFHMIHLASAHLYTPSMRAIPLLLERGGEIQKSFNDTLLLLTVLGLVFAVISVVATYLYFNLNSSIYRAGIRLIQRLEPLEIVSDPQMTAFLFDSDETSRRGKTSSASHVLMTSSHPIVLISPMQVVISINATFTSLFGYDPAHILGLTADRFLKDPSAREIIDRYIQDNSSESTFTATCKKDNGGNIEATIQLFNVTGSLSDAAYGLVFTDETMNNQLRKVAETLTTNNQALIASIVPSLLTGKGEISLNSATVVLLKFSDISVNAAPADICKACTDLWTHVDTCLKKYPKLCKIWINNGIYCAVASNPYDENDNSHCEEAFRFVVDCFTGFNDSVIFGGLIAAVESGPCQAIMAGGDAKRHKFVAGKAYKRAEVLLQLGVDSRVSVGTEAYASIGRLSFPVEEQKNEDFGKFYLFTPESTA